MKKTIGIFLALLMLLSLAACGEKPHDPGPEPDSVTDPAPDPEPGDEWTSPNPTPRPELERPPAGDPTDWRGAYAGFVTDHYDALYEGCGQISGVGFADLDWDGLPELALFGGADGDAMGVFLFDLADGKVVCVSSGRAGLGGVFESDWLSPISVRAASMEDFRLLGDAMTGEQFYILESAGGPSNTELIRFGRDDEGVLALQSLMKRQDGVGCRVGGQAVSPEVYEREYTAFFAGVQQTGFAIPGAFLSDGNGYSGDKDGCLAMLRTAADFYMSATG